MPYYLQNLKEVYNRVVQLIKKSVNALELFNYKYRIIRLKVYRAMLLINLLNLLNLGRDYILARLINGLVNPV